MFKPHVMTLFPNLQTSLTCHDVAGVQGHDLLEPDGDDVGSLPAVQPRLQVEARGRLAPVDVERCRLGSTI
jgi:hypothetical protein